MRMVPFDAVVFDCDGTLSQIEGINILADMNGVGEPVRALTEKAMAETGMTPALYAERLKLVKPTQQQLALISDIYYEHRTPDIERVIAVLHALKKSVYVISAGIYSSVVEFSKKLNIPERNVYAVDIQFDAAGNYVNYDTASPLVQPKGKGIVLDRIKQHHSRVVHVGDGLNDCEVAHHVDRFIGYGGAYYRESMEKRCEFYLKTPSIWPILEWILTDEESKQFVR